MSPANTSQTKRRDIQALRAFAVAMVVLYHFFPAAIPAGFIGVDVFFVISGFLITGHLMREVEASGRIDFAAFYARRTKRILPSAYVTLVLTIVAVLALLPMSRWENAGREGLASIFYVQNIYLARQSVDYLAEGTSPSVFQHFWSLAVEEQFYIVIPLLLALIAWVVSRVRRVSVSPTRVVGVVLAVLTVASLVISQVMVARGDASAYFVLHARFWELAAGALIAVWGISARSARSGQCFATIGWVGLLAAAVWTPVTSFPGAGALPAIAATVCVIVGSREVSRVILFGPVQHVGAVSYNLYLTHWPVLIVMSARATEPNLAVNICALLGSYLVALALYRLLDKPLALIRVDRGNRGRILLAALAASVVVAAVCVIPVAVAEKQERDLNRRADTLMSEHFEILGAAEARSGEFRTFSAEDHLVVPIPQTARHILPSGAHGRCKSKMADDFTPTCEFGDPESATVIALVGDSHIEQYLPAFELLAEQHGWLIRTYFKASCPFSAAQRESDVSRGGGCATANLATLETVSNDPDISLVVTSNRTSVDWNKQPGAVSPEDGFAEFWNALDAAGKQVVVLGDNPKMLPADATTDCVSAHLEDPSVCALPINDSLVKDYQVEPAAETPVHFVDTISWFCSADICPAVVGNVLVYRDEQHVTVLYAQTLAPDIYDVVAPFIP